MIAEQILSQIIEQFNFYDILDIVEDFVKFLKNCWNDFNRRVIAQQNIVDFKQKDRRFIDYLIEFQIDIDDTDYNAKAQLAHFKRDLFYELKNKFINEFSNITLKELVRKCQHMNNEIHNLKQIFYDKKFNKFFNNQFARSFAAASTFVASASAFAIAFVISFSENVMNLFDAWARFRFWHGIAEKDMTSENKRARIQKRRQQNLCLYCEESEHFVNHCSHKFTQRTIIVRFVTVAFAVTFVVASQFAAIAENSKNA